MDFLNKLLYWISTGLLLPTLLALLGFFGWALLVVGRFYGLSLTRMRTARQLNHLVGQLDQRHLAALDELRALRQPALLAVALHQLLDARYSPVRREKVLADFELACEKDLDTSRTFTKVGPILGLMSTLIPMQPALVGLGNGDVSSMAENLTLGFSATVVGLVVGSIGFLTLQRKQRWYTEDLNRLEFVHELLGQEEIVTVR